MSSSRVLIIKDAPRIDRYVYTVTRPDSTQDHFTTRLAAWRHLASLMPDSERKKLTSYSQVSRNLSKFRHHTIATEDRNVYQIKAIEVKK